MTTTTIFARIGLSLSLGLLVLAGGLRQAHAEPRRLGVVTFRGPGEGATRNVVMKVGKTNRYQIVGGQQIAKTASKLHVTLDTNDAFKSVAKELGIAAFITGETSKKKATLTVRNGMDGSVSAEASWTGPNPRKLSVAVSKTLWRRLGSAIDRTKAPSGGKAAAVAEEEAAPETGADDAVADEPEEKPKEKAKPRAEEKAVAAEEPAEESPPEKKSKKAKKTKKPKGDDEEGSETVVTAKADDDEEDEGPAMEALSLAVGMSALNRSLTYVQDLTGNSKYNLPAGPATALHVDLFPAAFGGGGGFASNVGLTASVAYLLPVVNTPPPAAGVNGSTGRGTYATYSLDWSIGAKVRLPIGLYGTLGYVAQRFQLIPQGGALGRDIPMVDYRSLRVGAGFRFHVTPEVSLMGNGAYLQCLSLGQIRSNAYFRKATCGAFEAGAAIGYRINSFLEVQAGADIRRYGLAFHVLSTDAAPRIAGGAVDQYLMGWAALAVVLGGPEIEESGGGGGKAKHGDDEESHGDGEEAPPPKKAKAKKTSDEDAEAEAEPEAEKPSKKKKKVSDEDLGL